MTLTHKGLFIVGLMLSFELMFVGFLAWMLDSAEKQIEQERRVRDTISQLDTVSIAIQDATIGLSKQVELLDDPTTERFYTTYWQHFTRVPKEIDKLKILVKDRPAQEAKVVELAKIAQNGLQAMETCRKAYYNHSPTQLVFVFQLHRVSEIASNHLKELLTSYQRFEESELAKAKDSRARLGGFLVLLVGANVLVAAVLAGLFTRNITQRLELLKENTQRLAAGQALRPIVAGNDEIASVDQYFHRMAQELTELSRKERAVVDNAFDLICSVDADEKFAAVNPACRKILGYEPDELIGKRFVEVVEDSTKDKTRADVQAIREKGTGQMEARLRRKTGELVDVILSAQFSPQERSLFCIIKDISEQKAIERLKQEFVAMVSHDLRTPLSSIRGTLQLIGEGVFDPKTDFGHKRVDDAILDTDRLLNLVNDLLDIEKLEAGKMVMNLAPTRLDRIIERSIESVRGVSDKANIIIESDCPEQIDILADEDRLVQVIVNLLSNAVKFSPKESTVRVEAVTDGTTAQINVVDHGRGISPENLKRLFQKFEQMEASDGKRASGTGLGLAICKAIVECHNGEIGAASEVGKGSTFYITLPLTQKP